MIILIALPQPRTVFRIFFVGLPVFSSTMGRPSTIWTLEFYRMWYILCMLVRRRTDRTRSEISNGLSSRSDIWKRRLREWMQQIILCKDGCRFLRCWLSLEKIEEMPPIHGLSDIVNFVSCIVNKKTRGMPRTNERNGHGLAVSNNNITKLPCCMFVFVVLHPPINFLLQLLILTFSCRSAFGRASSIRKVMAERQATLSRRTNETQIDVFIDLDCAPGSATKQTIDISTGIGFLDHVRATLNQELICTCIIITDVYRASQTWGYVFDHEMQRRSLDRRSSYGR